MGYFLKVIAIMGFLVFSLLMLSFSISTDFISTNEPFTNFYPYSVKHPVYLEKLKLINVHQIRVRFPISVAKLKKHCLISLAIKGFCNRSEVTDKSVNKEELVSISVMMSRAIRVELYDQENLQSPGFNRIAPETDSLLLGMQLSYVFSLSFFDSENRNNELKSDLKISEIYINSEVDQVYVSGNRKAVVILVPYRFRKFFRKIHVRLVRELEKKFSGKEVIMFAKLLKQEPCLISYPVEGFLKSIEATDEDAMKEELVRMSRAILVKSVDRDNFELPECYQVPPGTDSLVYVETVLGMKLSYGFALSFFDSENTNNQLKSKSKDLYINSKVYVCGNPKAVVIHVRYRLRKFYRKIHVRHVREFEKKFSGKDVMMINTRRILRPQRPGRSRTLTAVHNAILEDVVYPAEIIGKRIEYRQHGGSKVIKIFLEKNNAEYMLETFSTVYKEPFWERCVVFDA